MTTKAIDIICRCIAISAALFMLGCESPYASESETTPSAAAAQIPTIDISFEDLNLNMQADVAFRPWMLTDRVKELEGQRVRISGVMYPRDQLDGIDTFLLMKNKECLYGPGGQADHLAQVKLRSGVTTSYTTEFISVEGVLRIKPLNGPDSFTWSLFDLEEADHVRGK